MTDSEALVEVAQRFTARTCPWTYPHRADFFEVRLQLRFSIRVLRRTESCPISASIWPRVQGRLSLAALNCDRGDLCSEEFCWFELLHHPTHHDRANVPSYACGTCLATQYTSRHDIPNPLTATSLSEWPLKRSQTEAVCLRHAHPTWLANATLQRPRNLKAQERGPPPLFQQGRRCKGSHWTEPTRPSVCCHDAAGSTREGRQRAPTSSSSRVLAPLVPRQYFCHW